MIEEIFSMDPRLNLNLTSKEECLYPASNDTDAKRPN